MTNPKDIPVYMVTIEEEGGLNTVSLVPNPATEFNFIALSDQNELKLSLNEDKMILTGPALVANQKIYRLSESGEEYYVVFDEKTIAMAVDKYFSENKVNNIDHLHGYRTEDGLLKGNMIESWFSEVDNEIVAGYQFNGVPKGSWFLSYQIKDKEYWDAEIKTGKVKGFSIEGFFNFEKIEMKKPFVFQDLPPVHPNCKCELILGNWILMDEACPNCIEKKAKFDKTRFEEEEKTNEQIVAEIKKLLENL